MLSNAFGKKILRILIIQDFSLILKKWGCGLCEGCNARDLLSYLNTSNGTLGYASTISYSRLSSNIKKGGAICTLHSLELCARLYLITVVSQEKSARKRIGKYK